MIAKGVRAILFDAVGTLLHPEPSAAGIYYAVGKRWGSRLSEETIAQRFHAAFQAEEEMDRLSGGQTSEERERQRWQRIVAQVLDDVADPPACFQELYEHFARPSSWRPETAAGSVLAQLTKAGYVLGMASNYDRRLRSVLAGLPEFQPLKHLAISSEVGWRKPTKEFFRALSRHLELEPHEILFVGDDPINDLAGAQASGLQAVLFDPRHRYAGIAARRIHQLDELV